MKSHPTQSPAPSNTPIYPNVREKNITKPSPASAQKRTSNRHKSESIHPSVVLPCPALEKYINQEFDRRKKEDIKSIN